MPRACLSYMNKLGFIGNVWEPSRVFYQRKSRWEGGDFLRSSKSHQNWFSQLHDRLRGKIKLQPEIIKVFTQESQWTRYTTPYPTECNHLNVGPTSQNDRYSRKSSLVRTSRIIFSTWGRGYCRVHWKLVLGIVAAPLSTFVSLLNPLVNWETMLLHFQQCFLLECSRCSKPCQKVFPT